MKSERCEHPTWFYSESCTDAFILKKQLKQEVGVFSPPAVSLCLFSLVGKSAANRKCKSQTLLSWQHRFLGNEVPAELEVFVSVAVIVYFMCKLLSVCQLDRKWSCDRLLAVSFRFKSLFPVEVSSCLEKSNILFFSAKIVI